MTDKPLAAFTDAYKAGLIAAGIPNGPRVHMVESTQISDAVSQTGEPSEALRGAVNDPQDPQAAPMVIIAKGLNDVAQAQAQEAANISAQRIEDVRAQCIADTSALIAGQYPRI